MRSLPLLLVAAIMSQGMTPAAAETPALRLELNAADTVPSACRLSFVIENPHDADIAQAVFETVLFNADGSVNQLALFDFGAVPAGRLRVRQFDIADLPCDGLSRVLINGANTCEATRTGDTVCAAPLRLSSRTAIALVG